MIIKSSNCSNSYSYTQRSTDVFRLYRRIPDQETLNTEVEAWVTERNESKAKMNWQFTTEEACIKLKKLYPVLPE
ncbi:hypothetical protein [Parashewanella spongiae]|uniref:hypothetical protein n=1 Tax=Parashewanella spongiae TaxID=342950 RepID=UPI0010598488